MAMQHPRLRNSSIAVWMLPMLLLSLSTGVTAQKTRWIEYTGNDGTVYLDDDRRPALYTRNFGDCSGGSLINVTRFDAAYYKDNMTVSFHLGGSSALTNESLMLYIGVFAYGEQRFSLTFNPCSANIFSLCPMNSSVPIEANGIIPVSQADVANIPPIALTIPDFEGQAILRIFANSTQSQIACFSAVITNGASFSHPAAVGTILGIFALVALVASVAVAVHGHSVPDTRKHYAHSVSVLVVFGVYQHIFFTGALSMNWPSVLVAFWSNYAWAAGMIYSEKMQNTINDFIGNNRGNISMVGSAPSGQNADGLGGGYQLSQIYRRATGFPFGPAEGTGTTFRPGELEHALMRRELANSSSGFSWYGEPVRPGLPLPGNFSGFAGTLAQLDIPASNAFMTGFLWFLILIVLMVTSMLVLKGAVEALYRWRLLNTDHLTFFRKHWIAYAAAMALRICFSAFFMIMLLALFQFTLGGATGSIAVAGVMFSIFFLGMFSIAAYALYYRLRHEKLVKPGDRLPVVRSESSLPSVEERPAVANEKSDMQTSELQSTPVPWWRVRFTDVDSEQPHPHDDVEFMRKFGWLASRFRRSKWWFFAFWLVYEFVRACFYGGAAGHALTQVFGLLVWEILAFVAVVLLRPFESNRLNLLMVYFLGFSKVATVALSSAFDEKFGLGRILTTVIGVVIIVIQAILTICLMLAVIVGAISSYMSITRYRSEIKPRSWNPRRQKYLRHVDQKATDKPAPPPPAPTVPETPKEPYFAVNAVRREPKIEDEGIDDEPEQRVSIDQQVAKAPSRTMSMRSSYSTLPYGAKRHRASWSTRDFLDHDIDHSHVESQSRISIDEARDVASRHRAASLRSPPEAELETGGRNSPLPKSRHRRTASSPQRPKRNNSILNEEKENDGHPVRV